jgi:putative transposase
MPAQQRVPPRNWAEAMSSDLPRRKIPAHNHIHDNEQKSIIVYVTVCTAKRKHLLCSHNAHRLLISAWSAAHAWAVGRYVIMPDHIHLFCSPVGVHSFTLEKWVQYWKAIVTRNWMPLEEKPVWQKSFWDTQLRAGDSYEAKWDYVLKNPVRAGLCETAEDWLFQGELNVLEWY